MDTPIQKRELIFETADRLLGRKERALEKAIDWYFKNIDWDEGHLEEHAGHEIWADGTEIFYIADTKLITFGPMVSQIEITQNQVHILVAQNFTEHYV